LYCSATEAELKGGSARTIACSKNATNVLNYKHNSGNNSNRANMSPAKAKLSRGETLPLLWHEHEPLVGKPQNATTRGKFRTEWWDRIALQATTEWHKALSNCLTALEKIY